MMMALSTLQRQKAENIFVLFHQSCISYFIYVRVKIKRLFIHKLMFIMLHRPGSLLLPS